MKKQNQISILLIYKLKIYNKENKHKKNKLMIYLQNKNKICNLLINLNHKQVENKQKFKN